MIADAVQQVAQLSTVVRQFAWVTPRAGEWDRTWRALHSQAVSVLGDATPHRVKHGARAHDPSCFSRPTRPSVVGRTVALNLASWQLRAQILGEGRVRQLWPRPA
jgi:hypothetical protein